MSPGRELLDILPGLTDERRTYQRYHNVIDGTRLVIGGLATAFLRALSSDFDHIDLSVAEVDEQIPNRVVPPAPGAVLDTEL